MWKSLLMLSILLVLGFAKDSKETDSVSVEGSGNLSPTVLGDDEDFDFSGSGNDAWDLLPTTPAETETVTTEFIDEDQDLNDDNDSYKDEPELDYVDRYDNGNNKTIAIDMRKDETDEEIADDYSAEDEDTATEVTTVAKEEIDIEIDANIDPDFNKDLEIIENGILHEVDADDRTKVEVSKMKPTENENIEPKNPDPTEPQPPNSASLLNNNQFLAAIIVGGCVGLLLAVCVIAVFAYRLKKKDEGSYSLDDHKKLSPNYQYTQGQEYFA